MRKIRIAVATSALMLFSYASIAQVPNLADLESKARSGDAIAQFNLARMYDAGIGVRRNAKKAQEWYLVAAQSGNAEAQNSVGSMLQDRRKYSEAREWFEKASAQAHPQGTNNLAFLYDLGLGVPRDRAKAKELYISAAKLGWGEAMWNLANMAALGQAGPVDWFGACVWTSRALASAQGGSGELHERAARGMRELEERLEAAEIERCKIAAAEPIQ